MKPEPRIIYHAQRLPHTIGAARLRGEIIEALLGYRMPLDSDGVGMVYRRPHTGGRK